MTGRELALYAWRRVFTELMMAWSRLAKDDEASADVEFILILAFIVVPLSVVALMTHDVMRASMDFMSFALSLPIP